MLVARVHCGECDIWLQHVGYLNFVQITAYVCYRHAFAFSLLITAWCDVVMGGCHVLFSTCHFVWRGSTVVCLLKQSGYCIWIKMLCCFPASSTVTQTSATQIKRPAMKYLQWPLHQDATVFNGEHCRGLSLVYAFHTVTGTHIVSPNTHRRECVICVSLCGCMCTCTKTNINLSCNDTLSSCGRFFFSPPFFIWAQLQFNHVFKQQEISCLIGINCFVWQTWFSGR